MFSELVKRLLNRTLQDSTSFEPEVFIHTQNIKMTLMQDEKKKFNGMQKRQEKCKTENRN
jgi:hypothetical protein